MRIIVKIFKSLLQFVKCLYKFLDGFNKGFGKVFITDCLFHLTNLPLSSVMV